MDTSPFLIGAYLFGAHALAGPSRSCLAGVTRALGLAFPLDFDAQPTERMAVALAGLEEADRPVEPCDPVAVGVGLAIASA